MEKSNDNQQTTASNNKLLKDAVAEYESVLANKQNKQIGQAAIMGKTVIEKAAVEAASNQALAEDSLLHRPRKGANQVRSKSVLGRGLSALMSASAVSIDPANSGAGVEHPFARLPEDERIKGEQSSASVTGTTKINNSADFGAFSPILTDSRSGDFVSDAPEQPLEGGLLYLAIEKIEPNASQPRTNFVAEEIESLAKSISESGLLQPVVVRRRKGEAGPLASYELVAGERRWRAAKKAGLTRIPALVRQLSDRESLELAIVENVQRSDLNSIEEARAYQRLVSEFGATQEEVALSVSRDRASVANALRLLKLPPDIQQQIIGAELSAGHGRALLTLTEVQQQRALAAKIISEQLSVRATENAAKLLKAGKSLTETTATKGQSKSPSGLTQTLSPQQQELEERLRRALGTKVKLSLDTSGRGEIRISVFSDEELGRILDRLGA